MRLPQKTLDKHRANAAETVTAVDRLDVMARFNAHFDTKEVQAFARTTVDVCDDLAEARDLLRKVWFNPANPPTLAEIAAFLGEDLGLSK